MNIVVFGLGYVGTVSGTLMAKIGHAVTIVEINSTKVDRFNRGISPIHEPHLEEEISFLVKCGRLSASEELPDSLHDVDAILISVGTPTDLNTNQVDLSALENVIISIGNKVQERTSPLLIAICSTVPPGTTSEFARNILKGLGKPDSSYVLGFIPEFLREGSAVRDFMEPSRFIIGVESEAEGHRFAALRPDLEDRVQITSTRNAEMLKTVENGFHALKIAFANEVGRVSKTVGVNPTEVMRLLTLDTRQNISSTYLRPGFAFGGSCLPKDLRSFQQLAKKSNVQAPQFDAISVSNMFQIQDGITRLQEYEGCRIGILGLAFKANTDDIRESPTLELIERLALDGFEITVHDFGVIPENLTGANLKRWKVFEKLGVLFTNNLLELTARCDLLVVAQHNSKYFEDETVKDFPKVVDLTESM